MSASRERKQRLAGDEVLAAKQEKAAQDATKAKRKTVVYIVIGIVCAILAAALLAGAAVCFSGLLGFAGLLVPHMARRLVGSDNCWLLPAAALLGGSFVLLCDVLARVLFAPFELPVGIVMSLLGGPFFLYLLLRRKGGRVYA